MDWAILSENSDGVLRKSKTLLRSGFVFLVCLISCIVNAQTQAPKTDWGIRLGLNAVSITNYDAYQAGNVLTNSSYTNKNGYLVTGFMRFNFNHVFLQPELGWNNYRLNCSFSLPIENSSDYYPPVDLKINSKTINTNFLVGYNMVNDYPFLFGVFAGASAMGIYRTNYAMETADQTFLDDDLHLSYSGILGFSINISKIYFDLRYEVVLPKADLNLKKIPDFPENYQDVSIQKKESILSFSFGVMF